MNIVTWNMQGGTASRESKWTTTLNGLMKQVHIACIQECGQPPGNITPLPLPPWVSPPPPVGTDVRYFSWTPISETYYVLWINTDSGGGRVNIGVCCDAPPAGILFAPAGLPGGRASIGVQYTGVNVFSLHAFSGGGGDAPALVANIAAASGGAFNAAGDFNREPPTWPPIPYNICPPNGITYPGTRSKYDYMVRSGPALVGLVGNQIIASDHFPVFFQF